MLERCAGLVFGFVFHGGHASRVTDENLAAHLGLADHRAKRFIESFDLLPPPARQLLLSPREERIQFHLTANGAYGVLPDIERDFADHSLGTGRLAFWFDAARLVTSRLHSLRGVEQVRQEIENGGALGAPVIALVRLQEEFVGLVALGSELARIEDEVLADRDHIGRDVLGPLRRELSRYAREFSALRGAIHRAMSARYVVQGGPLLEQLPLLLQEAEDFERDAAALSDRARLLYEEIGSRIAGRGNRALSALTVISTLLLPPTFVVGAFGMNVGGIPWAQAPHGFWAALGFCLVLVLAGWALLRRFRILP
jgi:zinc transporter